MRGDEFSVVSIRDGYERTIRVEYDDPRFGKSGGLKAQFKPDVPVENGIKRYDRIPPTWPQGMIWRDAAGRQIPDFINAYVASYSVTVREVVERVQPGLIGWVPVRFTYSRGGRTEQRYFIDNRTVPKHDVVDIVASNMDWNEQVRTLRTARDMARTSGPTAPHLDPQRESKIHFKSDMAVADHIFSAEGLSSSLYISRELRAALETAGVTGVGFSSVPFGPSQPETQPRVLRPC